MVKKVITIDGHKYKLVNDGKITNVHFILDMSGSMLSVWDSTISGFNEYLDNLKNDKNEYKVSLTLFDDQIEKPYINTPIDLVKHLTKEVYTPRGMTALYDAVCSTINGVKNDEKNIVVIMTDGGENASHEYKTQDFIKIKNTLDAGKNWTFVFLGANQDAWGVASGLGFSQANVATYTSSALGNKSVFTNLSSATMRTASASGMSTSAYFSAQEKKDIEETK